MKRFAKIIMMVTTAVLATACLEETPYGVYSNKTFFQTQADAENGLMYAYVPINYIEYCQRMTIYLGDGTTSEYKEYYGPESGLFGWDMTTSNEEFLNLWKYAYVSITRVNTVIANVSKMEKLDDATKRAILGEAYIVRAFNYWNLVINFGGVPIHTEPVESVSQAYKNNSSIKEVYERIIEDLETAESYLAIKKLQGRTDKVAAQALLSRVYLYLASFKRTGVEGYEWVESADEMYAKCMEYASKVLNDQSVYALAPVLDDVYDVELQATCPEHIWITSMNREASGMEGTYSQIPDLFQIQLGEGVYISRKLSGVNDSAEDKSKEVMLMIDDNGWEAFRVNDEFYNTYDDKDYRKKLMTDTIYLADGSVYRTYSPDNFNSSDGVTKKYFFPFCRKYTDPKSKKSRSGANLYLIRFAEVALNYAEAAGPTADGYKWINAVRERAHLDPLPTGLGLEDFREAVIEDRIKELSFEAHHLYDLRRLHRVNTTYIPKFKESSPYAYYFPLPQREIDLNPQK